MKKIYLLRHADSLHGGTGQKDFERPLTDRGRQDSTAIGIFARQVSALPDRIIASPATRARQTTEGLVGAARLDGGIIQWNKDLYHGSVMSYVEAIQSLPDEFHNVMLVGHNPLVEETISELCGSQGDVAVRMPTGGLACVEHPANRWEMVLSGTSRLQWMLIPELINKLTEG